MKNNKYWLIVAFVFCQTTLYAQDGLGLRAGLSVEKKIAKKISLEASLQARYTDNIGYLQTYLGEFGLGYEIAKNLEISGYARYSQRRKTETNNYKARQRYYANIAYSHRMAQWKLDYRLRYQRQFKDNDGTFEKDNDYFRYKIELARNLGKKWQAGISADLFQNTEVGFDQVRPKVGLNYKLNKHNSMEIGLMQNKGLNGNTSSGPIMLANYKIKF
jgi:hypothetical protein